MRERNTERPKEVEGRKEPPAKVYPHFLQPQIAVLVLLTLFLPHCGHSYEALLFSSRSATSFLDLRPYLELNLAADLLFLPFLVCFAMIFTSV